MLNKVYDFVGQIYPQISEKALKQSEFGKAVFIAPPAIDKPSLTKLFNELYQGNKVKSISTAILKGKQKRFRGIKGNKKAIKKVFVTFEKPVDITQPINK